jgi:probable rRNA maturation factor
MKRLFFSLTKEVRRSYQPKRQQVEAWIKASLIDSYNNVSVNVIIVPEQRSQELNLAYRNKDKPTNVISLEYPDSSHIGYHALMGELILCDAVIVQEAELQGKSILAHYAHMVIHGMLHLQGLDHETVDCAKKMEALEISIMAQFEFSNPYILIDE